MACSFAYKNHKNYCIGTWHLSSPSVFSKLTIRYLMPRHAKKRKAKMSLSYLQLQSFVAHFLCFGPKMIRLTPGHSQISATLLAGGSPLDSSHKARQHISLPAFQINIYFFFLSNCFPSSELSQGLLKWGQWCWPCHMLNCLAIHWESAASPHLPKDFQRTVF